MGAMPTPSLTLPRSRARFERAVLGAALALLIGACAPRSTMVVAVDAPGVAPTADELKRDLYAFADDSMRGRESGTIDEHRAAAFLADRIKLLGLEPAGDSGFFQRVPLTRTELTSETSVVVTMPNGVTRTLKVGPEVAPAPSLGPGAPAPKRFADAELVFAQYGIVNKKLDRDDFAGVDAKGKILVMVLDAPANADSVQKTMYAGPNGIAPRFTAAMQRGVVGIVLVCLGKGAEIYGPASSQFLHAVGPRDTSRVPSEDERPLPPVIFASEAASGALVPAGWPARANAQFAAGTKLRVRVVAKRTQVTDYNVVGIVRGSDAALAMSYVAVGAHLDHDGVRSGESPDSIANGADDDGSGSVTALAIARAAMQGPRTRRSWLFVWHTAEEKGLLGSDYFTAHPTVPIDSIAAQLNADMVGRNGDDSLYIVGPASAPKSQSVVLGGVVDSVNAAMTRPFIFDRSFDSPTHPERIYFRSDHFNYAKLGVPIIFFTTGLHPDYHKVTDSPEKIAYPKMARVATLMWQVGVAVGNRSTRPK